MPRNVFLHDMFYLEYEQHYQIILSLNKEPLDTLRENYTRKCRYGGVLIMLKR